MAKIISVLDLVIKNIAQYRADGLVSHEYDCGCMKDGLAPCGDGPYGNCELALAMVAPDDPEAILRHPQTGETVWHDCEPGDFVYVPILVYYKP